MATLTPGTMCGRYISEGLARRLFMFMASPIHPGQYAHLFAGTI